jgi:Integrase core domain
VRRVPPSFVGSGRRRLSMRRIREVLRLRHQGLTERVIARMIGVSNGVVHGYQRRAVIGIGSTALPTPTVCGPWASATSPLPQARLGRTAFAERLIGSIRRECVDHIVVLGEAHLRRILTKYAAYYNESRTHRSLGIDVPVHRGIQHVGYIAAVPVLGGLHHHYCRN